ncbi:2-dehydro-3-deoxyphosphooctonate aldolase [Pseudoflavitalea sp. X16]|uniref:2-dehydro-3-deoxyphosphooctonate aldolase n=1 Tax=Paraflavitalea devenefica TaxID=2716334 RepID=UPI001423B33D|nr:2-dehydro-3-deoxyphosphooctonate aldolase [Paraflavitalea devenefica]NII25799.1 2-dehydro-3-deoxyphosphooctonate aldolase [Paraflavitalea devenefica]
MKSLAVSSILALALLATACSSSRKTQYPELRSASSGAGNHAMLNDNAFKLTAIAEDSTYGYTEANPIKVGGGLQNGASNEKRFLNALLGPDGEAISYTRRGSCCHFKTPNGIMGGGLLDAYIVTWKGQEKPIILFINMYDPGELKAPKGFTFRQ